jgi:hypothetical protein
VHHFGKSFRDDEADPRPRDRPVLLPCSFEGAKESILRVAELVSTLEKLLS